MNNEPDDFEDFVDQPEDFPLKDWSRGNDMSMWDPEDPDDDDLSDDSDLAPWELNNPREIVDHVGDFDYEGQEAIDWDKQIAMHYYYEKILNIVTGRDGESLKLYRDEYPEEQAILYWFFDNLDHEALNNEYMADEMQSVLDSWVVGDLTPTSALVKLKEVMDDYGVDGAC